ncbi:hypothetical protein [Cognaticolwellia mytili]|uniref:hypothetical protein n=1 Tax=Cognaticolwellia mytili TaxID=1888913 RepID=UPI000A16F9E9|nr:hypothetical protein [Cognaticolwellia mytili]
MDKEILQRTRIDGTDFYKDQHGQLWKKVAGVYKKTDEEPYAKVAPVNIKPVMKNKTKTCKKCDQLVQVNIDKCPHCGVSNPADSIKIQLFSTVFVLVVLASIFFGFKSCSDNYAEKEKTREPTPSYAFVHCMGFVESQLKSPSSADFSSYGNSNVTQLKQTRRGGKNEIQYLVTGYVDAQNSFGAQIRNNYSCKVTGITGGRWILDKISML